MTPALFGLLDMGLSFGVVLIFGIWQLRSLRRGSVTRADKSKDPPNDGGIG